MMATTPATITKQADKWRITGDVLMDNADIVLRESATFSMSNTLEIDFSAVTDVDTAALSLMLEWQRRAAAENCTITFSKIPENLNSLAALYGVTEFMPISLN